jgi:hypothetical protein
MFYYIIQIWLKIRHFNVLRELLVTIMHFTLTSNGFLVEFLGANILDEKPFIVMSAPARSLNMPHVFSMFIFPRWRRVDYLSSSSMDDDIDPIWYIPLHMDTLLRLADQFSSLMAHEPFATSDDSCELAASITSTGQHLTNDSAVLDSSYRSLSPDYSMTSSPTLHPSNSRAADDDVARTTSVRKKGT